jgi:hypothetical protein
MIRQILPNNNKRCYSNFSPTFREVNTPLVRKRWRAGSSRSGCWLCWDPTCKALSLQWGIRSWAFVTCLLGKCFSETSKLRWTVAFKFLFCIFGKFWSNQPAKLLLLRCSFSYYEYYCAEIEPWDCIGLLREILQLFARRTICSSDYPNTSS